MKLVILAAGIGSRLGNPFPKPLTPLSNGKTIMEMMTDNIGHYFSLDSLFIVVGFKKNIIMEAFPQLAYVYNPYFDQTNTSKSLILALRKCRGESVLWFNGDVVFDSWVRSHRFYVPDYSKMGSFCYYRNICTSYAEVNIFLELCYRSLGVEY